MYPSDPTGPDADPNPVRDEELVLAALIDVSEATRGATAAVQRIEVDATILRIVLGDQAGAAVARHMADPGQAAYQWPPEHRASLLALVASAWEAAVKGRGMFEHWIDRGDGPASLFWFNLDVDSDHMVIRRVTEDRDAMQRLRQLITGGDPE